MKIKQQLVYLPVKVEDEKAELEKEINYWYEQTGSLTSKTIVKRAYSLGLGKGVQSVEGYFFTPEQLNEYTANVIKSALETAAREAKVVKDLGEDLSGIPKYEVTECYYDESDYPIYVEEESIINVFEEVYQKLKV